MSAVLRIARRLVRALRGQGGLEDKLVLLAAVGGFLFALLVATLFLVQSILGTAQRQLTDRALPGEHLIAHLESSIAAAFGRQAQISSTLDLRQLESLRDRRGVEEPLRQIARAIPENFAGDDDLSSEARGHADALEAHVELFLTADAELLGSVERRHVLQAAFEHSLSSIDGELRAMTQDSQAISGMLRLEYVLVLRGVAQSLEASGVRSDLVRTAVLGDVRGALDATDELDNAVFHFDFLASKIGLASSTDEINSLVANEIPQVRGRVERIFASLENRMGGRPEAAARLATLRARFASIVPRVLSPDRPDSLVNLRRSVAAEAALAVAIRVKSVAAAAELTDDTAVLENEVATLVAESVGAQRMTSGWARLGSVAVTLLGLFFCVLAGRKIRSGIEELEAKNQNLTELKTKLEKLNANLESLVAMRTYALVERDRSMQRVLDSMLEGLATVSLDGTLRPERSRAFTELFGDPGRTPIWDVLFPDDPSRAGMFACGFEQIVEELLPFDVAVEQLPRTVQRGQQQFELQLRAVHEADRLDAVLLVVSDVTERQGALRAERAAREEQKVIANLLRDRRGFQRSIEEMEALIADLRAARDAAVARRLLHTIKGNAAVIGFVSVSEKAHALEDEIDSDGLPDRRSQAALEASFRESLLRIQEHLQHARDRIELDRGDYRALVEQVKRHASHADILALVETWQLEPMANLLAQLGGHARRLADQLGKRVNVVVEGNQLRIVNDEVRAFCASLVHAVRNAVDHGIELPDAREASGKSPIGTLRLAATTDDLGRLVVTVSDDGAGIDFDGVRVKARERGLPYGTRSQVLEALFAEGVTTRDDVTELSGRGVGNSAVRTACQSLGGEVTIRSEWGRGTELRCILPAKVFATAA